MKIVSEIKVSATKGIRIIKVWNNESWQYKVKKYTLLFFVFWIPGWKEEVNDSNSEIPLTHVEYFPSFEEAQEYANKIKSNFLAK